MKTKKIAKKLTLNKATITNIGTEELNIVKGGVTGGDLCSQEPQLCDTFPILECNSVRDNTGCSPSETAERCYPTQDCPY